MSYFTEKISLQHGLQKKVHFFPCRYKAFQDWAVSVGAVRSNSGLARMTAHIDA
jgi:hypothetical protein